MLKKHNLPYKTFTIFYVLIAVILAITNVLMTSITGDLSQAAQNGDLNTIFHFLGFLALIMVVRTAFFALSSFILRKRYANLSYRLRENFVKSLGFRPFRKIENENAGEALSIYSNDLPQASLLFGFSIFQVLVEAVSLVAVFVYMLTIDIFMTLAFFASFPILTAMQFLFSLPIKKKSEVMSEKTAAFNEVVNDSLQNTAIIAAFGIEEKLEDRYLNSYDDFIKSFKSYARTFIVLVLGGMIFSMAPQLAMIIWATFNTINGYMLLGQFVAFTSFVFLAGNWIMMLSQVLSNLQERAAGAKRLDDNIGELKEIETKVLIKEDDFAIKVENLSFEEIIKDLSFEIPKGSKTAIVGPSGSGKSTLLKLILGLYEGGGKITLGSAATYVPQDSFLFPESIAKNIAGEHIDREKLERAAKESGILDFINSLEEGFETILTENAENISGGQKQRIALARAFYTDAPIILFDEATSALDTVTEAAILEDLAQTDKTIVMIAHRESIINFCDNTIEIKGGK